MKMDEDLIYQILAIVSEIPYGKVASYKQIAEMAAVERNARLVGKILSNASYYGDYPCHRVVNQAGRCAPNWDEQRLLLEAEGVRFKENGHVDMKIYRW